MQLFLVAIGFPITKKHLSSSDRCQPIHTTGQKLLTRTKPCLQGYRCNYTNYTTFLYLTQLFISQTNYNISIRTKKTPYSDHQRIGHRRVFPFLPFCLLYNYKRGIILSLANVAEKNVRYKLQKSALGVFIILSVITDKIGDFRYFISYN